MEEVAKEVSISEYSQTFTEGILDIGICELENNVILRKRQSRNECLGDVQDTGILSPLDFVYPITKQLCCDSISSEAANLITKTVEFRLRQIIEEAIKLAFQRGSFDSFGNDSAMPFISYGDILSAMRYLCGSPNVIWSSEKPLRNYYISAELARKNDSVISETNIDVFQELPGRTMKYITCFSYSEEQMDFIIKSQNDSNEDNSFLNDIFHKIVNEFDSISFKTPEVSLHWLAVDGKFVFDVDNDTEFVKNISEPGIREYKTEVKNECKLDEFDDVKMSDFGIILSRADNEYLLDEKKEFLNYINSVFLRGIEGEYLSWNYSENNNKKFSVLNRILNTYGLSEKDFNIVTSVISAFESSGFVGETDNYSKNDNLVDNVGDLGEINDIKAMISHEEQEKNDFVYKINNIFSIIQNNADLETLLPYIVYFVYYNTQKLSRKFQDSGELPKAGSLRLLIQILTSIVRNQNCSNIFFYIHYIIECLVKIMTMNPRKGILKSINSSNISTYCLVDNLHSRYEASKLLEVIISTCCRNLPLGGARLINHFGNTFGRLLENRVYNMNYCNCLHIASLYGLVCGIRSLGDISVTSILFPKILSIFSVEPIKYNENIAYIQLYMEISSLLSSSLDSLFYKFEYINRNDSLDIIFVFWEKLIYNIENILGDGVLPVLLRSFIYENPFLRKVGKAMCFMDQCIYSDKIDRRVLCPDLVKQNLTPSCEILSKQYIDKFIKFYELGELSETKSVLQEVGIKAIGSMFEITI